MVLPRHVFREAPSGRLVFLTLFWTVIQHSCNCLTRGEAILQISMQMNQATLSSSQIPWPAAVNEMEQCQSKEKLLSLLHSEGQ